MEDLNESIEEYKYGATLRIFGELFTSEDTPSNSNIFLKEFWIHMRNLKPAPASHHCRTKTFCYKDFYICTHVFLRQDGPKQSLNQPYTGPHKVIERFDDSF